MKKKIADYVIELMKQEDSDWHREKIYIGCHEILKEAYQKYIKENNRKGTYSPANEIRLAWSAVTRDKRFKRTNTIIRSCLFTEKEHNHRIYKLKDDYDVIK